MMMLYDKVHTDPNMINSLKGPMKAFMAPVSYHDSAKSRKMAALIQSMEEGHLPW